MTIDRGQWASKAAIVMTALTTLLGHAHAPIIVNMGTQTVQNQFGVLPSVELLIH